MRRRVVRVLFYTLSVVSAVFFVAAMRPVPHATKDNCVSVKGNLESVKEGVSYDIIVDLTDDDRYFYINRGVEQGLDLDDMKNFVGSEAELKYVRHWTPLDPFGKTFHVAFLKLNGEVVYSELAE